MGSSPRLILIEDNPSDCTLVIRELQREFPELQVEQPVNAAEFERILVRGNFDLAIAEYQLPWITGIEVLTRIKHIRPDCPVIVFTHCDRIDIAVAAMKAGLDDYIIKSPQHYPQLIAAVRSTLKPVRKQWVSQPIQSPPIFEMNCNATQCNQVEQVQEKLLDRLQQEQGLLEAVLQQMPAGVIIAEAPSGKLILGNKQVAQIWRHPFREAACIADYSHYKGFHPDGQPYRPQDWPLARAISTGEVISNENIEYLRGDETRGIIQVSATPVRNRQGQIIAGVTIFYDITKRKQLETALRQSILRIENLYDINRAILSAQSPQEIAKTALTYLKQLLLCPQLTVVVFDFETQDATILALQNDKNIPIEVGVRIPLTQFGDKLAQLQQGQVYYGIERAETPSQLLPIVPAPHQEPTSFLGVPLIAQEKLIGALYLWSNPQEFLTAEQVAIAQEVADQLAIAIQQSLMQQQLVHYTTELEKRVAERTQELQAINTELEAFSYTVSHDLRAPLRAVEGFANAMLEDCTEQLNPSCREYNQRIIAAAQRLDKLILDLLDYSRLGRVRLHLKPVSLECVVAKALNQLENELKNTQAQITLGSKGLTPFPKILGHQDTLVQVLGNLLSNAIKFVPDSVRPQVQIWAQERLASDGQVWIRLWVEDNGIGIKPDYHEQIFRVFERLHGRESYPGSGIGLAIVRKGMERMGGHSGVESGIGQGSRFWIEGLAVPHSPCLG